MKFFKKQERDPAQDEAFAYRLSAITHRTRGMSDPYGRNPDADVVAA